MARLFLTQHLKNKVLFAALLSVWIPGVSAQETPAATASKQHVAVIEKATKINPTTVEILYTNHQLLTIDFYGDNIFRLFQDNNSGIIREPEAQPEAKMLVGQPRRPLAALNLKDEGNELSISTDKVLLQFNKNTNLFKVLNLKSNKAVVATTNPIAFDKERVTISFKENPGEYFYGGGVQNGRFSHKGKAIAIENQNSWTDGGVASPNPFYWSTSGYALMWHTFKPGKYDFGGKEKGEVKLSHEVDYLDVFLMVDEEPVALLNDFYQLTGNPILLPEFGFYEGHLNAYNRDYWKEDPEGILFEDGKKYKESQKDQTGIKESLNGEKNNYQFSARAVIDRYKAYDMPLGWILPNDGYGAGYGQTETLDGNIENLKSFGEYARKNGVEIGLWTQSDLHPKPEVSALLQRDIVKEVRDAGVRVLKTDVAWVGAGYSFGLNGVTDVAHIIPYYGNNSRPFTISLDGWAGTQRYAAVWSGDQTGGVWEYIRFHIPTYIGSGLSGQPNITSDMDGIFGGKNPVINIRDFEWKAFTPMQLNMDGWGANIKYPHALGEPSTSINRMYLKLKSALMPYTYSIARQAIDGMPMMRAMFLADPNPYTYGSATQYQYLYGPYFLVAPIYQNTRSDKDGNDIRNGIYLPEGNWIDYFTGHKYSGNRIINNFDAPVWKLPLFVKEGAIIPMANANNHVSEIDKKLRTYAFYPAGATSFITYEDDGTTEAYKLGMGVTTLIESKVGDKNVLNINIHRSEGNFSGFEKDKVTEFQINLSEMPKSVRAKIGGKEIKLSAANSLEAYAQGQNMYYYDAAPNLNQFASKGSEFEKVKIIKNPVLLVKLSATDVSANDIQLLVKGFKFESDSQQLQKTGPLRAPELVQDTGAKKDAFSLQPTWSLISNADYYEISFNGMLYSTIADSTLLFENLQPETKYAFKIRSVNKDGVSDWKAFEAQTEANPLRFAIPGVAGETTVQNQEGNEIDRLFDFDESSVWHTKWEVKAVPFDLMIDLKSINQLDKINYLPRTSGSNGILLKGDISYSLDKTTWANTGSFDWQNNSEVKAFSFKDQPAARYVKISVTDGMGGFGSGRQLYVFKVPGSESFLPGDINNDKVIDNNDFTSYTNYTGLHKGDADFEGYISKGDINKNNRIDAYDISCVATQLDGGVQSLNDSTALAGKIEIKADKQLYEANDLVKITVRGTHLSAVNAFGFALPYQTTVFDFISITPLHVQAMENLSNDRLHTNGAKVLYPTFINVGNKETLNGNQDLFVITFKAKRKLKFDLKIKDGVLVDKKLNVVPFN